MSKPSNLSRRSLFVAAAGAAIAGPAAVKSVLEGNPLKSAGNLMHAPTPSGWGLGETSSAENPSWVSQRLTNLVSERADFLKKNDMPATGACSARHGIDGLRSVSAANRARMLEEDAWRRGRESELSWFDKRIAEMKEKLGILGYLV